MLQNVGEISNRGWELASSLNLGALALSGGLSTVESRVRKIATGYTGDLMTGDRMLSIEDVADAVLFLASPLSDMIQGETLTVDGGAAVHV